MTCQNYESTIGKSTHRTIALRPDRKFQIHILVKKEFNWGEANAIRLNIDFDVGQEVRDVEQIILKEEIEHVTTGLVFDRCNEGEHPSFPKFWSSWSYGALLEGLYHRLTTDLQPCRPFIIYDILRRTPCIR